MELTKTTRMQWRRFLASPAGQEGMLYLREKIPGIHKGQFHEMAYDGGFTQGFIKALDTIPDLVKIREDDSATSIENE